MRGKEGVDTLTRRHAGGSLHGWATGRASGRAHQHVGALARRHAGGSVGERASGQVGVWACKHAGARWREGERLKNNIVKLIT